MAEIPKDVLDAVQAEYPGLSEAQAKAAVIHEKGIATKTEIVQGTIRYLFERSNSQTDVEQKLQAMNGGDEQKARRDVNDYLYADDDQNGPGYGVGYSN